MLPLCQRHFAAAAVCVVCGCALLCFAAECCRVDGIKCIRMEGDDCMCIEPGVGTVCACLCKSAQSPPTDNRTEGRLDRGRQHSRCAVEPTLSTGNSFTWHRILAINASTDQRIDLIRITYSFRKEAIGFSTANFKIPVTQHRTQSMQQGLYRASLPQST
jgi:hypothetical protein